MSSDNWDESIDLNEKKRLLKQIEYQKKKLEEEKRKSLIGSLFATTAVFAILALVIFSQIQMARFTVTAVIVEVGTIAFVPILVSQYQLLKKEIGSILPDISFHSTPSSRYYSSLGGGSQKKLEKIYDVNKNTLDKLFDKLKTFSTTWLAVAGGFGSTVFAEILRVRADLTTALVSILCSALIWSITQNLYGILNYDLAK